jgi:hypothetical protein
MPPVGLRLLKRVSARRRLAMPLKDLMGKAKELAGTATEATGKLVDEFNEALPTMRALGFTIKDLRVGMGLVPEIGAKLIASTDTIDVKKIKELIEKHPENKTLVGALKALELAYNVRQQVGDLPFKGVEIDVTLGLPPHIGVAFVSSAPPATPIAP